jgi:hypothetical protein
VSGNGVTVALRFVNAEGQASGKSIEIPGDTKEWKEFTVTATAPERATESEISIATTADGTALTDFDDFRLLGLR